MLMTLAYRKGLRRLYMQARSFYDGKTHKGGMRPGVSVEAAGLKEHYERRILLM